jgi:N-acetylneuraminic acid mutarotase
LHIIGYALGSALVGDPSVTSGIVSGRRTIDNINFIQTDAAMNPGNSGGPVINSHGEVVGIATMIIRSIGDINVQGINFATPSVVITPTLTRLLGAADAAPAATPAAAAKAWALLPASGAPSARIGESSVWTGKELIVWGGLDSKGTLGSGARYNPTSNTWTPLPSAGAPSPRVGQTAVWTGSEMIVWGGARSLDDETGLDDGARYNPTTNRWTPLPRSPLSPRGDHVAVWTGKVMLVWGGLSGPDAKPNLLTDGAAYNPATNTWTLLPAAGAPSGRENETAVWDGKELLIWGGTRGTGTSAKYLNDGVRYDPAANRWSPIAAAGAPVGRISHTAVWTGKEMLVFGGTGATGLLADGGRYDPVANTWKPIAASDVVGPRSGHTAVWTGSTMLVWGGSGHLSRGGVSSGASYNPATNAWTALPDSPLAGRVLQIAEWTGKEMIVWGGMYARGEGDSASVGFLNDGARYQPTDKAPAPAATATPRP